MGEQATSVCWLLETQVTACHSRLVHRNCRHGQIKRGTWYNAGHQRTRVTQYHQVITGTTALRWLGELARCAPHPADAGPRRGGVMYQGTEVLRTPGDLFWLCRDAMICRADTNDVCGHYLLPPLPGPSTSSSWSALQLRRSSRPPPTSTPSGLAPASGAKASTPHSGFAGPQRSLSSGAPLRRPRPALKRWPNQAAPTPPVPPTTTARAAPCCAPVITPSSLAPSLC